MPYSELAYFEGFAFAHIAAWEERQRIARKAEEARRRFMRRPALRRYA